MPERPGPEPWRRLLTRAPRVVDSLVEVGYEPLAFRFAGGTVLAFHLRHRASNDIDPFIDDAQDLSFLSPRLNDTAARLAEEYAEQANTIKLVPPDGAIDLIVAGDVTRLKAGGTLGFEGREIALEPPAEILAKK